MTENTNRSHRRKLIKIFGKTAGAIMIASIAVSTGFANFYLADSRKPDSTVGRVVPLEVKGAIVYATEFERSLLNVLQWTTYGSGAFLVLAIALYGKDAFRERK